jgi:periplasmic protein TonB
MGHNLNARLAIGEAASDSRHAAAPEVAAGARLPAATQFPASTARWRVCLALAACFHATAAAAFLARWNGSPEQIANAPVITVELAALPVAPDVKPSDVPPGPQQSEAQPEPNPVKPIEKVELPPEPQAGPMPVAPPPKSLEKPKDRIPKQQHASLASAPANADRKAERAAAPSPGASSHDASAAPNWKSLLVAMLERNKRYPSEAQARGEHGVVELAFSIDRRGGIHHARVAHSSGSSLLDREALAMLERAAPLPSPPPEIGGAEIPFVAPIRYSIP